MKFAIKQDGSYSHYGTDGKIPFDIVFNESNQPFNHKYIDDEWILDKALLIEQLETKFKAELDELGQELSHNETYFGTENYDSYKEATLGEISALRDLLNSLNSKTVDELEVLI
ncbi:MAG: hypothetical protein GY793_05050 [Proteobacteria bacterium]|nr:hypothetical protein [Pseudomonadota bacterium]